MEEYKDLLQVVELLEERALNQHRNNLAAIQAVKEEVQQIDGLRAAAQAEATSLGARRMSGADTLWQSWLMQQRAALMRNQAIAQARERESFLTARTAMARAEAVKSMEEVAQTERRNKRLILEAERLEELGRLRAGLD
ncbi:MAG: hypothetical protein N4A53_10080 [Pelagimonas sp.]|nr:hypothetical protein [Pelagimonas sp.]